MKGHLILVGLPGSGKSTVGPLVAAALGCAFLDFDVEIERREGSSVQEIFAAKGEAHFREIERALTMELKAAPPMVLAPGGGWITSSGNLELLSPPATSLYLSVSPGVALSRMGEAAAARPLLTGAAPLDALQRLLEQREQLYLQANHTLSTDLLAPPDVAVRIIELAGAGNRD